MGLVWSLLAVHAGLLSWSATRHSPNVNEPAHLAAGISHWQMGNFELYRVNPPLVRSVAAIPALVVGAETDWTHFRVAYGRPEFVVGPDFVARNGERTLLLTTLGRWACIPFSIFGGYICFLWARNLYGDMAGLLSLTLWCFSPNILGHASCFTPDAHAAAVGVGANYLLWRWLRKPTVRRSTVAGVMLGVALLTKTTWVFLFMVWPTVWGVWRCWPHCGDPRGLKRCLREGVQLLWMLLVGLHILNSGYLYSGSFSRLGEFQFISHTLGGKPDGANGNRFRDTAWATLPVPFPADFVLGIDVQKRDFERHHPSYLRGRIYRHGFWYYYLYGLAVKVPLGTWLLVLTAIAWSLQGESLPASRRDVFVLLFPFVFFLILVSSEVDYSAHFRYALPILPYAFIWLGQLGVALQKRSGWSSVILSGLAVSVLSSLSISPHWLSYFNELSGGPARGHQHLANSNIDWGQDLLYLRRWQAEHPAVESIGLAYYGMFHPNAIGIRFEDVPRWLDDSDSEKTVPGRVDERLGGPSPGWYAVSVNFVLGHPFWEYRADGSRSWFSEPCFTYFRDLQPVATMGYSMNVYHVTEEDVRRLRTMRSLTSSRGPHGDNGLREKSNQVSSAGTP